MTEGYVNRFDAAPYADTTCKNCGVALRHNGCNSGITWVQPNETGQLSGSWECGPCPDCPGAVFHQHVPLVVLSETEVAASVLSIYIQTLIQNGAPHA